MTSFRRVAFPLGIVAICGGALLFSLSTANGQSVPPSSSVPPGSTGVPGGVPAAGGGAGVPAAPTTASTTGSPSFRQTIGVSPVQIGKKPLIVLGGTGNDTYDLQNENIYSLLREDGTPIPNVLHPLSTAKPSFILERLIVLSLTGNTSTGSAGESGRSGESATAPSAVGGPGGATGAAQAPAGPSEAQKTVTSVRQVVDAELSRGTGRLGGAHRQKLQLLSRAIRSLEAANQVGAIVNQALGNSGGEGAAPSGGATGGTDSKLDPREILYGRARITARQADRFTPNIP